MSRVKSITIKDTTFGTAIATGAAVQIAKFNIAGFKEFTITVRSCATAVVNYSIQTAPRDETALYSDITSTSVAAGSSVSITKNTFTGNHQAWLTVLASSTATITANSLRVIFSATEE